MALNSSGPNYIDLPLDYNSILKKLKEYDVDNDKDGFGDYVLGQIARTGMICHPWELLKPIIAHKMSLVVSQYKYKKLQPHESKQQNQQIEDCQRELAHLKDKLLNFKNPPWTLQRLCEILLLKPETQHYSKETILFAISRLLKVTSTLSVLSPREYDQCVKLNSALIAEFRDSSYSGPLPSTLPNALFKVPVSLPFLNSPALDPYLNSNLFNFLLYLFTAVVVYLALEGVS
eukprot:TRINITY_DN12707_c0_g1_i1.p1 TRINITY_DN12707_c0_g1~~TRINITY_DN12707_c0_g1_i1.p1  ORF type:complete len:232 (+),score=39.00 TRINITY_DN12707_c0_g1_i1:74-769(+)